MHARVKPVGSDPVEFNGVTMRRSWEMIEGVQALWFDGRLLKVCRIGDIAEPGLVCDTVTLHPHDYEAVLKSEKEAKRREARRRFKGPRVSLSKGEDLTQLIRRRMHGD